MIGATYWPDSDVAVKVDYIVARNQSEVVSVAELVQRRTGMVVLMMTRRWHPALAAAGAAALALLTSPEVPLSARMAPVPSHAPAPSAEVVEISAERFAFTPSEIKTRAGVPLEIRLRSEDTDHGFRIVGTKIDVRIPKRGKGQRP